MRSLIPCVALIVALSSCAEGETPLSDDERVLIAELGFDEPLIAGVRGFGESIERLVGITPDFEPAPAIGLLVVTKPGEGRAALAKMRTQLNGTAYSVYLNDEAFGSAADKLTPYGRTFFLCHVSDTPLSSHL
jgi:hypothetical protein